MNRNNDRTLAELEQIVADQERQIVALVSEVEELSATFEAIRSLLDALKGD